ncbi:MAG TPA: tetratricopeptide repeat protein [Bacteroidetes bacterium]|nr:tetratricopeptide repeat protein [Bacteroidota bacterium]
MKHFILGVTLLAFACGGGSLTEVKTTYEAGDYTKAISLSRNAIALDSTNVAAWEWLAKSYEKAGKQDSALYAWESAYARNSSRNSIRQPLSRLYIAKASRAADEKEYGTALNYLGKAEKITPNSFDVYFLRGHIYRLRGYPGKAEEQFAKASEISKSDPRLQEELDAIAKARAQASELRDKGIALYKKNRWTAAGKVLKKSIDLNAEDKDSKYYYHMARGRRLYKKGSVSALWDAIEHFGLAANARPDNPEPHYYMGLCYKKKDKKDYEGPIASFEQVIALAPDSRLAKKAKKQIRDIRALKEKRERFWGKKKKR